MVGGRRGNGRGAAIVAALALGSTGCSALADVNGGYVRSFTRPRGGDGAGFNYDVGAGDYDGGVGYHLRTKFTREVAQGGLGLHVYALNGGNLRDLLGATFDDAVFVRGGADLIQVGRIEGHGNFSTACPFAEIGFVAPNPGLELTAGMAYDWRLSSARNDVWAGVFVGTAFAGKAGR